MTARKTRMVRPETKVETQPVVVTEIMTPFDSAIGSLQFMEVVLSEDEQTTETVRMLIKVRATMFHLEGLQETWRKEWCC